MVCEHGQYPGACDKCESARLRAESEQYRRERDDARAEVAALRGMDKVRPAIIDNYAREIGILRKDLADAVVMLRTIAGLHRAKGFSGPHCTVQFTAEQIADLDALLGRLR